MKKGEIRIGTSGWVYAHWKGRFYPSDLPQAQWLDWYMERFDTVELNATYYRLPKPEQFRRWREKTPKNFLFVVKANRYITHRRKLIDAEDTTKLFFRLTSGLREKRGPLLFQFPPSFGINLERLDAFLKSAQPRRKRIAVEFRNDSWHVPELYELLRKRGAGFVVPIVGKKHPPPELTADFGYLRFHGVSGYYRDLFGKQRLKEWVPLMQEWQRKGADVFCYFNNDQRAYSVRDALTLREMTA